MTVPGRPAVAGAAAAVLLTAILVLHSVIFTVLAWLAHPWRIAALTAAALVLAAISHGTFTRHGAHRGPRVTRDERDAARKAAQASAEKAQREAAVVIAAIEARRPAIAAPRPSADWAPRFEPRTEIIGDRSPPPWPDGPITPQVLTDRYAPLGGTVERKQAEPRTDVIGYEGMNAPQYNPVTLLSTGPDGPDPTGPLTDWEPSPGPPAVVVTDDPAGRHARPRVHAFTPGQEPEPYCGQCGREGHWRGDPECGGDAMVTELITRRREDRAADAIAAHLTGAGFKVHDSNEDAVKSMWTRAMGLAIADVEAARR
jgi:hypothetical protein